MQSLESMQCRGKDCRSLVCQLQGLPGSGARELCKALIQAQFHGQGPDGGEPLSRPRGFRGTAVSAMNRDVREGARLLGVCCGGPKTTGHDCSWGARGTTVDQLEPEGRDSHTV
ncbi:hypothetical protein NDU88_003074 [Pleurodeles waltl]|uniref:Uncharacterized protein n=1 Tax=Pleurodeles waltl TaxID=8319 RepID=A0AAV7KVI3_PLEWA|nr:hypothetical protein NDU88_003074 [Pleurodeles waltl]